jgi:hypothetical protein
MLSRSPAVKWACRPLKSNASSGQSFGKHLIGQSDNLRSARVDVAMHVADEMSDDGGFGKVARVDHEHIFIGRAHDVGGFSIMVQQLTRMKNGASRQFEREDDTVGRLH